MTLDPQAREAWELKIVSATEILHNIGDGSVTIRLSLLAAVSAHLSSLETALKVAEGILGIIAATGLSVETSAGTPVRSDGVILDEFVRLARYAIGAKERPRTPFITNEKISILRRIAEGEEASGVNNAE